MDGLVITTHAPNVAKQIFICVLFLLALVLVYDYHPGSQTLLAKYFTPTSDTNNYQDPFQGEARPFR